MKFLPLLSAALVLGTSNPARGVEHRYDVLEKLLTPFVSVLAKTTKNPNRALLLTARLERLTDLPPELAGAKAEFALEYPDKLRLRGPLLGEEVTVCRKGQQIWASPGSRLEAMLDRAVAEKRLPKADPKYRLEPFQLPLPEKQLVFLPALLQVEDGGTETMAGRPCRVLTLTLMPELERSLDLRGWRARVWVDAAYKPARLTVARPGWEVAVRFETVEFSPQLPDATWRPAGDDVIAIDPSRYQQLMQAIVR